MVKTRKSRTPSPNPIPKRICKCGCKNEFQPGRRNQLYLNKQHADFGYNHGKRKVKKEKELEVESILRHNDSVLDKFYSAYQREEAICFLNNLMADGFNRNYFVGFSKIAQEGFYFSFNFMYHIYQTENQCLIKIRKR
jgi:hypothetical protein